FRRIEHEGRAVENALAHAVERRMGSGLEGCEPKMRDLVWRSLNASAPEARHPNHPPEEEVVGVDLRSFSPRCVKPSAKREVGKYALIFRSVVAVEADPLAPQPRFAGDDDRDAAGGKLDPRLGSIDNHRVGGIGQSIGADL